MYVRYKVEWIFLYSTETHKGPIDSNVLNIITHTQSEPKSVDGVFYC